MISPATLGWFDQSAFRVRLEWGWRGACRASARGDILVVVDVLSFSTLAAVATQRGAVLYPCQTQSEAQETAARVHGVAATRDRAASEPGTYSLSPRTFDHVPPGLRVAIASPNGATCCRLGQNARRLFVVGLVNARAGANAVAETLTETGGAVTLLACGERWQPESSDNGDGALRFALEDMLGAGAVAAHLPPNFARSPEVRAAQAAYRALQTELESTLLACGSGTELVQRGFRNDVVGAARLNVYNAVPALVDGERLEAYPKSNAL